MTYKEPVLSVSGAFKSYPVRTGFAKHGSLQALRGIDLQVGRGQTVGIVGESGCGKSTLARLLLGIERADLGDILMMGRPIQSYDRLERARLIQPIFQDPYSSLNPRMRISEIIRAPLDVRNEGRRPERNHRVIELMASVGLAPHMANAYPNQLSGGQRQRVAIARALIARPEILICDEPTSALDVSVQSQILNLLNKLRQELDLSLILISHNLAVVQHLADRIAVMYLGKIVEEGTASSVFDTPRHPYTVALLNSVLPARAGAGLPTVKLGTDFPSPLSPPSGCAFHPRCENASPLCSGQEPAMTQHQHRQFWCHHPSSHGHVTNCTV